MIAQLLLYYGGWFVIITPILHFLFCFFAEAFIVNLPLAIT